MRLGKGLAVAAALVAGLGGVAAATMPAQAAGDTGRYKGCAAHWRNTAAWNECVDSPGVDLQLQVTCKEAPYAGPWQHVQGTLSPVNRFECIWKAVEAHNAYRS